MHPPLVVTYVFPVYTATVPLCLTDPILVVSKRYLELIYWKGDIVMLMKLSVATPEIVEITNYMQHVTAFSSKGRYFRFTVEIPQWVSLHKGLIMRKVFPCLLLFHYIWQAPHVTDKDNLLRHVLQGSFWVWGRPVSEGVITPPLIGWGHTHYDPWWYTVCASQLNGAFSSRMGCWHLILV